MAKVFHLAVGLLALAGIGSCADDIVPPGPTPHVRITGGNEQAGTALDTLALPLEVTVVDDAGEPVAGRTVSWTSEAPGGKLVPIAPATDADGRARAIWILGLDSGEHIATASVTGEEGAVEFTATASPVTGFKAIALMQGSTIGTPQHMCALSTDSLAWCWGGNEFGQLGNGTIDASAMPREAVGGRRFATIQGDLFNTCGLQASGELWCWGRNTVTSAGAFAGIFGNGSPAEPSSVPVRSAQGLLLRDFDLEAGLACGVTIGGRAYCWGDGDGALGTGTGLGAPAVPTEIIGDRQWREIAVSDDGRCAIAEDHRAYCWYDPDFFPRWPWIGIPQEAGPNDTPLEVEIAGALTDLSIGEFGACGISLGGAGTAVCWGFRSADPPPGPAYHRLGSGVRKIVSDGFGRAALDAEGQLWVWNGGCCDTSGGLGSPRLLFPGIAWLDVSVADGIHVISARDSIVFSLGQLQESVADASFELVPVPVP